MLTEEHLEIIQEKLQHRFADINQLKRQIALFHAYYLNSDSIHVPFSEVLGQGSALEISAIQLSNQNRQRKQEFFCLLYESIKHYFSASSEKDRRDSFNYFYKDNQILFFLADVFKLSELAYLMKEDPLYEDLKIVLCLFFCNAVFSDLISQNNQTKIFVWLNNLLMPLYREFIRNKESSQFASIFSSAALDLKDSDNSCDSYFFDEDFSHQSQRDVETFEQAIFKISFEDMHKPLRLDPLLSHFTGSDAAQRYHVQWLPYIIEESRATIAQQLQLIKKVKPPKFHIKIKHYKINKLIVLSADTDQLPELDHPFQKEAVLVQFKNNHLGNKFSSVFAIATKKYFNKKTNRYQLELHALPELLSFSADLVNMECEVDWLAGLIAFDRMYEACRYPSHVPFMKQLVMAELPPWPRRDQIAYLQAQSVQMNLNPGQFAAVSAFHQADDGYYCLQGPPGTGKTTTIVNLLNILSQDSASKIMVCAPSNKAVRVIAERTAKVFPDLSIAITGVAKDLPECLRPFFVNDHVNIICHQMDKALKKFQDLQSKLMQKNDVASLQKSSELRELQENCQKILGLIDGFVGLCQVLLSPSKFRLKPEVLSAVQLLREQFVTVHSNIDAFLKPVFDCIKKLMAGHLDSFSKQIVGFHASKSSRQPKGLVDIDKIKNSLRSHYDEISQQFFDLIKSLENSSESIEILLLQRAQIVFCTLVSSGRPWLKKHISNIDILIVDEAAQCVEPEALIPLKFQPKKCLHVGDPKQLPATLMSQAAQDRSYGDSMMLRLIDVCGQTFQMLNIQYRMHPAICAWPSQRHYAGELCSAEGLEVRPSPFLSAPINSIFKSPCVFFDVKGNENRNVGYSKSTNNPQEADALIKTLCHLLPYLQNKKIGIISFYAAQVSLLKEELSKKKVPNKANVTISTVDGFQGEEKDIILLSAVRTSDDPGFLKDIRRVNVAVTRPLHHLYIFGNRSSLESSNTDFTRLIRHYEQKGDPHHKLVSYEQLKM